MTNKEIELEDVISLIKSIPADQAIQKIKSALSGYPETAVIDGKLLIQLHINDKKEKNNKCLNGLE